MVESRKRINLLWRPRDWELLERVRAKLGEVSDAATFRRALEIAEALVDKRARIDGREVVIPTEAPLAPEPETR